MLTSSLPKQKMVRLAFNWCFGRSHVSILWSPKPFSRIRRISYSRFFIFLRRIVNQVIWLSESAVLQNIYKKISRIEEKISHIEKRLVPEVKLSKKELNELESIRQDIKKGNFVSEKELFSALSE